MELFAGEIFLNDTSSLDSRSQHILLSREVVGFADSVHFAQVAVEDNFIERPIHLLKNLQSITLKVLLSLLSVVLTIQRSRSAGTQQLFQKRPAHLNHSIAS